MVLIAPAVRPTKDAVSLHRGGVTVIDLEHELACNSFFDEARVKAEDPEGVLLSIWQQQEM